LNTWLYSIPSVILVSLLSLIGVVTLALKEERLRKITSILVSFAVGALLGDAFIHLIPEALDRVGSNLLTSLYIVGGLFIFFVVEKIIRWKDGHNPAEEHLQPVVTINLIGDGVHNLMDGLMIGVSYIASTPIGIATTLAVVLHEIPKELGSFGVLVHGGLSVKKALVFNLLSALTAIIGTIISLVIGTHITGYTQVLLPLTAGGFIYIAAADLIPELQHDVKLLTSLVQCILIVFGVGIMALLLLLE
jgi:zinc and cadmium transporter